MTPEERAKAYVKRRFPQAFAKQSKSGKTWIIRTGPNVIFPMEIGNATRGPEGKAWEAAAKILRCQKDK